MQKVHQENLPIISRLYKDGLSVGAIANRYNVSSDAMFYFFRKNRIKRRSMKECNSIVFARKNKTFYLKTKLSLKESLLKVAGIMLYWGEGSKWEGEKIVDFVNSSPGMIRVFLSFLRKICGVNEEKLRIFLYCYEDQNMEELIEYWSKVTKVPKSQFTKPYIKKNLGIKKIGKMKYGVVHIRYNDKKLLILLRDLIEEYTRKLT